MIVLFASELWSTHSAAWVDPVEIDSPCVLIPDSQTPENCWIGVFDTQATVTSRHKLGNQSVGLDQK